MIRVILFRGKKTTTPKDFVYGTYVFDVNKTEQHFIVDSQGVYHPIILETIGQFIGAVDQEGVRVFEGDILYDEFEDLYDKVIFCLQWGAFDLHTNSMDINDGIICDWSKVAGNIYDNPNLLGENNCSVLIRWP